MNIRRLVVVVCALCLLCAGFAGAVQSQTVLQQKCCTTSAGTEQCCCMPQQSVSDDGSASSPCDDSSGCCPDALGTDVFVVTQPPVPGYRAVVVSVLGFDLPRVLCEIASAPFIPPRGDS